jgi:hypothetical protein
MGLSVMCLVWRSESYRTGLLRGGHFVAGIRGQGLIYTLDPPVGRNDLSSDQREIAEI